MQYTIVTATETEKCGNDYCLGKEKHYNWKHHPNVPEYYYNGQKSGLQESSSYNHRAQEVQRSNEL